jgi:hypothetical protein
MTDYYIGNRLEIFRFIDADVKMPARRYLYNKIQQYASGEQNGFKDGSEFGS